MIDMSGCVIAFILRTEIRVYSQKIFILVMYLISFRDYFGELRSRVTIKIMTIYVYFIIRLSFFLFLFEQSLHFFFFQDVSFFIL